MLRKLRLMTFALTVGLYATPSTAQIFDIEVIDYGGLENNATIKGVIDNAIQNAENEVNEGLPSGDQDRMMEGMANSSSMAGKGIGTDYASNMKVFLIGAGVGAAADLEKPKDSDGDLSGIGVAPGVIVGFNLGFMDSKRFLGMDTDRLNLYFNFMNYNVKKEIEDKDKKSVIDVDMLAFGTHMRYDWIKGKGSKLLGWGGVKFTFGFEYNKTKFNFKTQVSEDVNETVSGTGEVISGTITGNPVATIDAGTMSVPLALSTDVQILYILSLYTGIGADYNMGEAKGKGNLNGNTTNLSCTGGAACGGSPTIQVRPTANLDTTAKVTPFTYRAFAGVQVNLPWTRIFVQADKSLSNEVIAATAGLRFAF